MRSSDRWPWAPVPLLLIALPAVLLTVGLDLRVEATAPMPDDLSGRGWPYAAEGVVLQVLAAVILWRHRRHPIGWAMVGLGVLWTLDGLAQAYLRLGIAEDRVLPGVTPTLWFLLRFAGILPLAVAALLLVFPSGTLPGGRWRTVAWICLGLMTAGLLLFLVAPAGAVMSLADLPPGADPDPTSLPLRGAAVELLQPVGRALAIIGFALAMVSVVARYRTSRDLDRDRMRWLLWAVVVMVLVIVLSLVVDLAGADWLFVLVGLSVAPAAMTVAIVEPRLVPVKTLLVRTVVYGAITALVVGVDLLVLAGLSAVLGDALAQRQVVLVALLLAAVLYGPLRGLAERWVRRLVLGERVNPYGVVATLASRLESTDHEEAQLGAVVDAVAEAFALSYVEIEVARATGERVVAARGARPARTRAVPITYRDERIGSFTLAARGVRSQLTARDEVLLGDVVRQVATAIRATRLADELQASRERLVLAREEERRRIRRDLHDGLGPAMSAVVFRLESVRLLARSDPSAADRQLVETRGLVQEIIGDVRRLVHELRPPALDDRGLVGALRQLADNSAGGVVIRVSADLAGELPAAVEVAAYRIASEALTNTLRHARARTCSIRLASEAGRLVVSVTDDGVGIPAEAESGVGLVSMRERAAELGGAVRISSPVGGGTTVTAWLPEETQ